MKSIFKISILIILAVMGEQSAQAMQRRGKPAAGKPQQTQRRRPVQQPVQPQVQPAPEDAELKAALEASLVSARTQQAQHSPEDAELKAAIVASLKPAQPVRTTQDTELEQALKLSIATQAEDKERRALAQAVSESERAYKLEQDRRFAEEKKKKEEAVRKEQERRTKEEAERNKEKINNRLIAGARNGNVKEVMEVIMLRGAAIDFQDERGLTALAIAIHWDNSTMIHYLIRVANANINIQDKYGDSILMKAARYGNLDTFQTVLAHNPDITLINAEYKNISDILITELCISSRAKIQLLENHIKKLAQTKNDSVGNEVSEIISTVTGNPKHITDLVMDYYGNDSYPLSDDIQVPFKPKTATKDTVTFINPDKQ